MDLRLVNFFRLPRSQLIQICDENPCVFSNPQSYLSQYELAHNMEQAYQLLLRSGGAGVSPVSLNDYTRSQDHIPATVTTSTTRSAVRASLGCNSPPPTSIHVTESCSEDDDDDVALDSDEDRTSQTRVVLSDDSANEEQGEEDQPVLTNPDAAPRVEPSRSATSAENCTPSMEDLIHTVARMLKVPDNTELTKSFKSWLEGQRISPMRGPPPPNVFDPLRVSQPPEELKDILLRADKKSFNTSSCSDERIYEIRTRFPLIEGAFHVNNCLLGLMAPELRPTRANSFVESCAKTCITEVVDLHRSIAGAWIELYDKLPDHREALAEAFTPLTDHYFHALAKCNTARGKAYADEHDLVVSNSVGVRENESNFLFAPKDVTDAVKHAKAVKTASDAVQPAKTKRQSNKRSVSSSNARSANKRQRTSTTPASATSTAASGDSVPARNTRYSKNRRGLTHASCRGVLLW
jgi:hypothetical protein